MSQTEFPCKQCGAELKFQPGTTELVCPYCGCHNQIADSTEAIEELDYRSALAQAQSQQATQEVLTVHCTGCAAEFTPEPNVTADQCPFCGTPIVTQGQSKRQLTPRALLPFHITAADARQRFKQWVAGLWFAPSKLKEYARTESRLAGMYVPYWTYDCRTTTRYTGQRGEDYWTTETYTTFENGKSVTKTRQVRKTRWYPASGTVRNTFDDVLVLASQSLPRKYTERLEPWDLANLTPYTDEYLSGFRAESYQVDLAQGFEHAKQIMDGPIRASICRDIGGDHQRISSMTSRYDDITFKHILLPVWLSAYRYADKVYRFLINARTGEVQGERPWSFWKIFALVAGILAAIAVVAAIAAMAH